VESNGIYVPGFRRDLPVVAYIRGFIGKVVSTKRTGKRRGVGDKGGDDDCKEPGIHPG